ncbi:MAG: 50S ribosomal protein L11 methyltransferase [Clostridiales bacterium]|nr:50S ribosomal protein L11 methyltransferase [Clostridiales bacterium]
MKFYKLTVDCTTLISDDVSYVLHEAGSLGEVFDDYFAVEQVLAEKRWDYADASLFERTDGCSVSGFYTIETDIDAVVEKVCSLKKFDYADFSSISMSVSIIDSKEWEDEWKKYYKPFSLGKITIVPEWIEYSAKAGEKTVRLNPGPAFGTGTHETTSMCIELMQKLDVANARVLDFGCGSGILGICAKALGANSVVFIDNDEQAISATEHNCKLNAIDAPEVVLRDVRDMSEPADIVLANITADVLIDVEPIIKSALKKDGYAIISGIITERAEAVKSAYLSDFELFRSERKNEWSAFIFKL